MRVNIPENLTSCSCKELEKILNEISLEMRPIVEELSRKYKQIDEEQNLKKAS